MSVHVYRYMFVIYTWIDTYGEKNIHVCNIYVVKDIYQAVFIFILIKIECMGRICNLFSNI